MANLKDDYIYLNLALTNKNTDSSSIPLIFNETRTQPVLDNPSKYVGSVIRFSIPGINIPLLIFPVEYNASVPSDINYSQLTVTLNYGAYNVQTHLTFVPYTQTPKLPNPPALNGVQQDTPYYYVYYYTDLLRMYNDALKTCFAALDALVPGNLPADSLPPQFIYSDDRVSLIAQQEFYDLTPGEVVTPIKLFVNYKGVRFFTGIPLISFTDYGTSPNGKDYQFNITNNINNFYTLPSDPSDPPEYLIFTSQFTGSLAYWNDLQSVVILSSGGFTVVSEFVSNNNPSNNNDNFKSIVTDFIPIIGEQAGDVQSVYVYNPSAEFRRFTLNSQNPINELNFSVKWVDKNNNIRDIYLLPGQTATIKFMFQKKL